jgi:DNA-binding CsgD family transcriptional regulator
VTPRQRQVLALIAAGLTTKEMAHELRITERGVSAHISRLLAKYDARNRASLVARSTSETVRGTVTLIPRADTTNPAVMLKQIAKELDVFQASKLLVTVTLGQDPVFVFMNDAAGRAMGMDPGSLVGVPVRERFADPTIDWWLERSDEAFRTGVPVSFESVASRWLHDDGTWVGGSFDCVVQPVRGVTGAVIGILWICTVAAS